VEPSAADPAEEHRVVDLELDDAVDRLLPPLQERVQLQMWNGARSLRKLPWDGEVRSHGMCQEMPVILVNRVVGKKINGKNGGPRRRRGSRGR
jgi:hypothetical protein